MSVSGLRVLRGPDWRGGDTDGGEGHVGTVLELLGNHRVRVLWDMGQESTCSAGHDGKCEVRVLDTAQIGVRHPETECSGCGESDIWGMLWRCRDCAGCDLCPLCYGNDTHNPRHQFLRIDTPGTLGRTVPKRKTSVKHRSLGLFPGSKVTRGKDWQWGDQDGGQGSEGKVKGYENVLPDSSRSFLSVEWPSGDVNSYRVGFYGNVDLRCVEEEVGPCYYRDHLPVLDTDYITQLSLAMDKAPSERDSTTTTARRDVETEPGSQDAPCVETLPDSDSPERQESGSIPDTHGDSMAAELPATGSQQGPVASPEGKPRGDECSKILTGSEQGQASSSQASAEASAEASPEASPGASLEVEPHSTEVMTFPSGSEQGRSTNPEGIQRNVKDLTTQSGSEQGPSSGSQQEQTTNPEGRQHNVEDLTASAGSEQGLSTYLKTGQHSVVNLTTTHSGAELGPSTGTEGSLNGISDQQHTTGDITTADGDVLTPGTRVAVRVGLEKLLELQQQCGADKEGVNRVLGETGHVTGRPTNDSGGVTVKFPRGEMVINVKALVKVEEFQTGDKVRLRPGVDEVKVLNCRVGWRDGMEQTAGRVGRVVTVDSEGDLLVSFGRHHFLFSPACCTHVTSGTPLDSLKLDVARMKTSGHDKSGTRIKTQENDRSNDRRDARLKIPEIDQSGARMKVPELDKSGARMKTSELDKSGARMKTSELDKSGARMDTPGIDRSRARLKTLEHDRSVSKVEINNRAGESKSLFKTPGDSSRKSGTSGRLPDSISLISDCHPARLLNAVQRGDHHTVREMCASNWDLVEFEIKGVTALILACNKSHRQVVRVLLDCGADVNHCVTQSPLETSLRSPTKDEEIAVMLLERGANPFGLDEMNHTYMHMAAIRNMSRVVKLLADRGVDVNALDDFGDTALHLAIGRHCYDTLDVLMAVPGVDLSIKNTNNHPALHHAAMTGNARAVDMILDRDTSQLNRSIDMYTPLHCAAHDDHDDCLRLLVLKGGAEVNRRYHHDEYTPLHLACVRGMYRAAEALLELGADIQALDDNGSTPLHLAISGRRVEDKFGPQSDQELEVRVSLACLLVSNGAVLDARDWRGVALCLMDTPPS